MRTPVHLGFALVTACLLACPAHAQFSPAESNWTGHFSYAVGYKGFESDWSPVEDQWEFGLIDVDFCPPRWPVSLCLQVLTTYAEEPPGVPNATGDYSGAWELNLGVRKVIPLSHHFSAFLGGGVGVMGASVSSWFDFGYFSGQVYEDSDFTVGGWGGAGLYYHFSEHWHVGAEAQYSYAEIELFDHRLNAGGFHALALVGYHW